MVTRNPVTYLVKRRQNLNRITFFTGSIPNNVPQILINRERLPHLNFDVELYGDGDIVIDQICRM